MAAATSAATALALARSAASASRSIHDDQGTAFWLSKAARLANGPATVQGKDGASQGLDAEQVCALADAFIRMGQHARAYALLKASPFVETHLACIYRAALSLTAMRDWIAAMELLGTTIKDAVQETVAEPHQRRVLMSGVCYLRGVAQQSLQNTIRAADCYKEALLHNPLNVQAVDALANFHLLSGAEERETVRRVEQTCAELRIAGSDVIAALYKTRFKKFAGSSELDMAFMMLGNYGLFDDVDVRTSYAESLYYRYAYEDALVHTKWVLERDAFHHGCLLVHLAILCELGRADDIFLLAHRLVDHCPEQALSWYAVGVYYLTVGRHTDARRFFSKSTVRELDRDFPPGWIGFGHAFSAQGERDPAINAYTTAARLYKGFHLPWLFLGMEYQRINDLRNCKKCLDIAASMTLDDHLVLNEQGVQYLRVNDLKAAREAFEAALAVVRKGRFHRSVQQAILVNLAHVRRKQGALAEAAALLTEALIIDPEDASAHVLLGMVRHQQGQLEEAIDSYNVALARQPTLPTAVALLESAMEEFAMLAQIPQPPPRRVRQEQSGRDSMSMDMEGEQDVSMELD